METKEKIIKTAIALFVKQGFDCTPTSNISSNAHVATGTLFHHFKTKEELINAAYIYVKQSMKNSIFKNLRDEQDAKEKLKIIWLDLIRWGHEKQHERQFLEKYYGSTYIDTITVEQAHVGFEPGKEAFVNAKKENILKDLPLELISDITFSLFYNFANAFEKKKTLSKKELDESFTVYWGAIGK